MSYLLWSFLLFSAVQVNGNVVFVKIPPHYTTKILSASLECVEKNGVQPDTLQHLIDWSFEESDKIKQFIYCFGSRSGFIDSTGHFKTAMMLKFVENHPKKNQFADTLHECNRVVGKDKYDTVFKAASCFHHNTPILFNV